MLDQCKEIFAPLEVPEECDRLLEGLAVAADATEIDLRLVVALRTDHLDRLLPHPSISRRGPPTLVPVLPLTADQLVESAVAPARRHGIALEPALVTTLVADVVGQPGGLPLFQFTLHELAQRRTGDTLTLALYEAIGGVDGAVTRRAEELFGCLGPAEQEVARQVFLRLVHIGDGPEDDLRRRVTLDELASLQVGERMLQTVLAVFGDGRLLRFDRDAASGAATVKLAHDALLSVWDRLLDDLAAARADVQVRTVLTLAALEWCRSGEHPDYLLTGAGLDHIRRWAGSTGLLLTELEQRSLDVSSGRARQARRTPATRIRRPLTVLLSLLDLLVMVGSVDVGHPASATSVALVHRDDGHRHPVPRRPQLRP